MEYAVAKMGYEPVERFSCVMMNKDGGVIKICDIAKGSSTEVKIKRDEVIRLALQCNAEVVVLCHNHPNGNYHPSKDDVISTCDLKRALHLINIDLWDHIIVTRTAAFSFKSHKLLPESEDFESKLLRMKEQTENWAKEFTELVKDDSPDLLCE